MGATDKTELVTVPSVVVLDAAEVMRKLRDLCAKVETIQAAIDALRTAPVDPPGARLSIEQYARRRGVSTSTIRRLMAEGLPTTTIGARTRIEPIAADTWCDARGKKPTTPATAATKQRKVDVDVDALASRCGLRVAGGRGR